jgi:hypothetical protein
VAWLPQIAKGGRGNDKQDGDTDFADEEDRDLAFLMVMDEGEADERETQDDDENAQDEKVADVHGG